MHRHKSGINLLVYLNLVYFAIVNQEQYSLFYSHLGETKKAVNDWRCPELVWKIGISTDVF